MLPDLTEDDKAIPVVLLVAAVKSGMRRALGQARGTRGLGGGRSLIIDIKLL